MDVKDNARLFTGPYRATKLWNEIVDAFCRGVPLKRHRRQMRQYNDCFTARDAVDWLHHFLRTNPNFGPDVTRLQTIQLLCKFQQCNIICSVNEQNDVLLDNQDLYKLKCSGVRSPLKSCQVGGSKQNIKSDADAAQLTVAEIEQVWKSVILERLASNLRLESLESVFDETQVNPKYIIHNVTRVSSSGVVMSLRKSEEIPSWVTSAMKCLASWPKASGDESCLPKYPGFERDVFKVIKEYFLNLEEPLTTFGMYNVLLTIFERVSFLKSSGSRASLPKACLETEFLTEEPVTRLISPPKRHVSVASLSEAVEERRRPLNTARSCSVDNFQRAMLADKRASFRDRLKLRFRSNSRSATVVTSTEAAVDDCSDEKNNLDNEVLWLMNKADKAITRQQSASSSAASFHSAKSDNSAQFLSNPTSSSADSEWRLVECLRLALLVLSPDTRRSLHLMLKFMDKVSQNKQLTLVNSKSNRQVMLSTFATTVLYPKKMSDFNESSILNIAELLMSNEESIFTIPDELKSDVQKRLALCCQKKGALSYCEMVSREEYERQKSQGFEGAMLDLLNSIINNQQLSDREKNKKLKQFKKMYPDIYSKALPTEHLTDQRKSSQIFSRQLRKLRVLRI